MQFAKIKSYLQALRPQIIIISLIIIFKILSLTSTLLPPEEIARIAIDLLATYGVPLIMLASFIENFAGFGTYVPGSVAILAAMAATAGDPARAMIVFIAIVMPALVANILSYYVGYFSRGQDAKVYPNRTTKGLFIWYASTYWHPQFAALSAIASGGEGIPFFRYLSHFLPVSFLWSIFWGLLMYNLGYVASVPKSLAPIFYIYLIGWIIWGIWKHKKLISK